MNWYSLARKIGYWVVPQGFNALFLGQGLRLLHRAVIPPAMKAEFARNKEFHNIHQGQRCFILGTGPSINKQNLKPLRNEICFAVSFFWLHPDIKEISPLYHVDAPNHPPYGFELPQKNFEGFSKFYPNQTTYFLGHNSYQYSVFNFLEQNPQFKKETIRYLDYSNPRTLDESNYNNPDIWDICKPLFGARTVIYCAIQVAAYMGFKSIYLLGCDHDYLLDISRGSSRHFYDNKDGLDDSADWLKFDTERVFEAYYLRWKQYRLMREYLEPRGCYIYNATEGGLLDVFPRVSLEEALSGTHERKA